MDQEDQLAKKIETYSEVAKENPNVDVSMLMLNALQTSEKNVVSAKAKRWAYLISLGFPPLGLLWALKYYSFSDESDAKEVAWMCVILTVAAIAMFAIFFKLMLSSTGTSLDQIQKITPQQIQELGQ